jgi:hypothetical protein
LQLSVEIDQGAAADPEIRAEEDQSFLRALKFLVDKEGDTVKLPRAASSVHCFGTVLNRLFDFDFFFLFRRLLQLDQLPSPRLPPRCVYP